MQAVINLILVSWPNGKDDLPSGTLPYLDQRDTLSYVDGIIMKGEAIVIPGEIRNSIKSRLHSAQLGYHSMLRRARGTVFWPGMSAEVKQLVDACEICQEMKPRNGREPLVQHEEGGELCRK